jgi:hypothetical protein
MTRIANLGATGTANWREFETYDTARAGWFWGAVDALLDGEDVVIVDGGHPIFVGAAQFLPNRPVGVMLRRILRAEGVALPARGWP